MAVVHMQGYTSASPDSRPSPSTATRVRVPVRTGPRAVLSVAPISSTCSPFSCVDYFSRRVTFVSSASTQPTAWAYCSRRRDAVYPALLVGIILGRQSNEHVLNADKNAATRRHVERLEVIFTRRSAMVYTHCSDDTANTEKSTRIKADNQSQCINSRLSFIGSVYERCYCPGQCCM